MQKYFKEIYMKNRGEGIWFFPREKEVQGMFSDTKQDRLFELEDISWWFKYRAKVIYSIAKLYFQKDQDAFDVGGGNGYTTWCMQRKGYKVACLEPSIKACKNAKKRGVKTVICGTLEQQNIKDDSVPQFFLLDVLEHIENDIEFLGLIRQKLVPGGKILITVPALQVLWSSEDDEAGHYRRYTVEQLKEKAAKAGFRICYISYFFSFLFLPILLVRVGLEKIGLLKRNEKRTVEENRKIHNREFLERGGIVQLVLRILEKAELRRLIRNRKVWIGSSIICVLERP